MCYWCLFVVLFDVYLLLLPFALNSIHPMPQERSASKLMVFSFTANISVKAVMRRLWGSELSGRGDQMRQMVHRRKHQRSAHRKVRSTKLEATALRMNQLRASWFTRQSAQWCLGMFRWETDELAWSGFAGWSHPLDQVQVTSVDHLFLPLTSKCPNTSNDVR